MELDEFIAATIRNIHSGLTLIGKERGRPAIQTGILAKDVPFIQIREEDGNRIIPVSNIEFEVALTDSTKDGVKSGIGVLLGGLSFGAKGENEVARTSLTKIKFVIPIMLE